MPVNKKKNSKRKGKVGELELARLLKSEGYDTRRSQQFCGINGDSDVVGLPGIHIECKRVEKLNIYDAIAQAEADHEEGKLPAVFHRRNRCPWLVTMKLSDWLTIYREWEASQRGGEDAAQQPDTE